jgi:hypothetical protein
MDRDRNETGLDEFYKVAIVQPLDVGINEMIIQPIAKVG